jgi:hypothetical protein
MELGKQLVSISNKAFLSKVLYRVAVPCKFYEMLDPTDMKLKSKINGSSKLPRFLGFSEVHDLKMLKITE